MAFDEMWFKEKITSIGVSRLCSSTNFAAYKGE